MEGRRLYPIGIQTFSKLREGNYVYVDKTELVYRMTHGASGYMHDFHVEQTEESASETEA